MKKLNKPLECPVRFVWLIGFGVALLVSACSNDAAGPNLGGLSLRFASHPGNLVAGERFPIRVTLVDEAGRSVGDHTGTVSLALISGIQPPLRGTTSVPLVNGVAQFDDLAVERADFSHTLVAMAAGVQGDTTFLAVSPAGAQALTFETEPTDVTSGAPFEPAVSVAIVDSFGNVVPSGRAEIEISIAPGSGVQTARLEGRNSRGTFAGRVDFDDLEIDRPGPDYRLIATAPALDKATSDLFDVAAWFGVPTQIDLDSEPGDPLGQGLTYSYSQVDAVIDVEATGANFLISIEGDEHWTGRFNLPQSLGQVVPGQYDASQMSWTVQGRGCETPTGGFTIDSVRYAGSHLVSLDLTFEQHCRVSTGPLRGTVHWDESDSTRAAPPIHPIPSSVWEPNGALLPGGDYVYLESDSGDFIGGGQTYLYVPTQDLTEVTFEEDNGAGRFLAMQVAGWTGEFRTMNTLVAPIPGYYPGILRRHNHNPAKGGMSWGGQGRGCNSLVGWFAIDAIAFDNGQLSALTMRFEQYCEKGVPSLRGAIRWGS